MSKTKGSNKANVSNVKKSLPKSAKISIFFVAVLLVAVGVTLGYNKYLAAGSDNKSLALKAKALGPSDFTTVFDRDGFAARGCVVQQSNGTRGVIMTFSKAAQAANIFNNTANAEATLSLVNSNGTLMGHNTSTTWWNNSVTALKLHSYAPGDQLTAVISGTGFGVGGSANLDTLRNCDSSLNSTSF